MRSPHDDPTATSFGATPPHPDQGHEWFSVEIEDTTFLFDVTFLTSAWTCIFGRGCPGIGAEPDVAGEKGCCSHGAHFVDKADRKRVKRFAGQLTDDQWQFRKVAGKKGGPIHRNEDGEWVTRVHDGACIFLNRPGFHAGAGCALHLMALETNQRPLDVKPTVCWQLPLRLDHHTADSGHLTYMLTEWKRRDWGEGGDDFHWWCTETDEAFQSADPVWVTLRDEIVEMVGEEAYAALADHLADRTTRRPGGRAGGTEVFLPHPAVRRQD
jgi:hypothetical protein